MEPVLVKGIRCIKGRNIQFENKVCFGLQAGEKVSKIGIWKSTSSYESKFIPYVIYSGQIQVEEDLYAAFLLPREGITGWTEDNPEQPLYMLFLISEEFNILYQINDKVPNAYPHKPIFERVND